MRHPSADPHTGLADLDDELDVGALIQQEASGESPLRKASERLRSGSDEEPDDADDEAGGDDSEEEGLPDEGESEEEETPSEEPSDSEESEGEEEEPGEEEEEETKGEEPDQGDEKTFDLLIPPIAKKGGRSEVDLQLQKLPQEYHDLLKGHINRSQQLDVVHNQLEAAREHETVARFVNDQPLAAMLMIDQEDRDNPRPSGIGEKFVQFWLAQNPEEGLKLVEKMGFNDPDSVDADRLKDRAELARLKVKDQVHDGLTKQSQKAALRQFISDTGATLRSVALEMGLDEEDHADFVQMAAARLKRSYDQRVGRGQDPKMPRAEVLSLIQPVMKRFGGEPESRSKKKGSASPERMKRKVETAERHRKVGGGKSAATRLAPAGLAKFKGKDRPRSVKEASARLRATK